jgi:hypothetical protein
VVTALLVMIAVGAAWIGLFFGVLQPLLAH